MRPHAMLDPDPFYVYPHNYIHHVRNGESHVFKKA